MISRFGILLFHAFCKGNNSDGKFHPYLFVEVSDFEAIIELFLDSGVKFIDPKHFGTTEQQDAKDLGCLLTLDDGYFNNFFILDVLEKYGVKALLYSVKEQVEKQELFWWDVFYMDRIKSESLEVIYREIQELKRLKFSDIKRLLIDRFGDKSFAANTDELRPLTRDELTKIVSHPFIEVGVHGRSHKILTNYSEEEIFEEISECKTFLEDISGETMKHLSYPNGNYDQRVISTARKLGFLTGVTVRHGLNEEMVGRNKKKWLELFRVALPFPRDKRSIIEQAKSVLQTWKEQREKNWDINI